MSCDNFVISLCLRNFSNYSEDSWIDKTYLDDILVSNHDGNIKSDDEHQPRWQSHCYLTTRLVRLFHLNITRRVKLSCWNDEIGWRSVILHTNKYGCSYDVKQCFIYGDWVFLTSRRLLSWITNSVEAVLCNHSINAISSRLCHFFNETILYSCLCVMNTKIISLKK